MFLKQEQMKPTYLTQLTSYCLLSTSMGQNISWEDSGYLGKALLRVTCKPSCHYPLQIVPPPVCILWLILAFRTTALFIEDLFNFFLYSCLVLRTVFSVKLFPSKLNNHFLRIPRLIGDKIC